MTVGVATVAELPSPNCHQYAAIVPLPFGSVDPEPSNVTATFVTPVRFGPALATGGRFGAVVLVEVLVLVDVDDELLLDVDDEVLLDVDDVVGLLVDVDVDEDVLLEVDDVVLLDVLVDVLDELVVVVFLLPGFVVLVVDVVGCGMELELDVELLVVVG